MATWPHCRTAEDDWSRTGRLGPAHHDQHAAADPRARQAAALDLPELTPAETKQLAYSVLTDAQKKRFEETLELDFSFGIKGSRASAATCSTSAAPSAPSTG
jgi:hypothetical protein